MLRQQFTAYCQQKCKWHDISPKEAFIMLSFVAVDGDEALVNTFLDKRFTATKLVCERFYMTRSNNTFRAKVMMFAVQSKVRNEVTGAATRPSSIFFNEHWTENKRVCFGAKCGNSCWSLYIVKTVYDNIHRAALSSIHFTACRSVPVGEIRKAFTVLSRFVRKCEPRIQEENFSRLLGW